VKEDARLKRNIQRQVELYPTFAARVVRIIATLEAAGFRPRIQDAWRSAAAQAELFAKGTTKVKFGFHNVTGTGGRPESLAVDLLDDDYPVNPRKDYLLQLANAAQLEGVHTGIDWGLPPSLREAVKAAVDGKHWNADVKIGWDPTHVEPADITISQARAGKRPG